MLQQLQAQADTGSDLDWDLHFLDAAVVRTRQHAADHVSQEQSSGRGGSRSAGEGLRRTQNLFESRF
ncbi:hypothetical protein D9Y22_01045 [Methylorubrum sp. DB1722]|nr:hypothetical protein [Methylorubrum sp. DB1722]